MAIPIYIPVNSLEGSLFSAPSPAFIICRLFDDSHSELCEVIPQSGFLKKKIFIKTIVDLGFPSGSDGKEPACNAGDQIRSLGWEDPLEKGMATHSCLENLALRIPGTEEPGGLQSMGSPRVGHG